MSTPPQIIQQPLFLAVKPNAYDFGAMSVVVVIYEEFVSKALSEGFRVFPLKDEVSIIQQP